MSSDSMSTAKTTQSITVTRTSVAPGSSPHGMRPPAAILRLRERLDAFPTQLVLVVLWTVIGLPVCLWLRQSILWVSLMSWYAIVVSHFGGHLAWRAKRAAQGDELAEPSSQPPVA